MGVGEAANKGEVLNKNNIAILNPELTIRARKLGSWRELPVCVTIFDSSGVISYANQALWGFDRQECVGVNFESLLPDDFHIAKFREAMRLAMEKPDCPVDWSVRMMTSEGIASFQDQMHYSDKTDELTNVGVLVDLL